MKKTDLIHKLKQLQGITDEERAYLINLVNTKKKYGLVWEDKPEDVEEQLRENLPVLKEVKDRAIINGEEHPNHILIEGDNLHALTALTFTHEGKIDTMYFDPPYNTGNKSWRYNNDYVEKEDSFRHSKWLSFMAKRLKIAKKLLASDGLIVVTIDDYEVSPLTLLLDEIFGENNRVGILIIENNPRGRTTNKFFATCHEYALVYSKNAELANLNPIPLNDEQKLAFGYEDNISPYRLLPFRRSGGLSTPSDRPNSEFSLYYSISAKNIVAVGGPRLKKYPAEYEPSSILTLSSKNEIIEHEPEEYLKKNKGDIYPIMPIDSSGNRRVWRWSERENILMAAKEGDFNIVTTNGSFTVQLKDRIKEGRKAKTMWSNPKYDASSNGTVLIDNILNKHKVFDYPKSLYAVKDTLHVIENKAKENPIYLDIFGGSGTTMHAIVELNKEDGRNRQCILVTNNENNICEEVTYERNKRVIEGYTNAKGEKVDGLANNNLRYYKSEFVGREPSIKNKKEITRLATELLCIKEDIYSEQKQIGDYQLNARYVRCFQQGHLYLLVIYDEDVIEQMVEVIQHIVKADKERKTQFKIYVFSNGQYPYTEEFEEVLPYITLCALPDAIYKAYQNVLPKRQRQQVPELEEPTAEDVETSLQDEANPNLFNQAR